MIKYNSKLIASARQLRKNSTLSESLLWKYLKNKQFKGYKFYRQKPIDNYVVDFFCKELMLAIEIDGVTHENKFTEDLVRQKKLESLGIRFLRFNDLEVKKDMKNVLWVIGCWIDEHSCDS